jgi:tripartite-type tricarboxylate transporter receptor subunit TctC
MQGVEMTTNLLSRRHVLSGAAALPAAALLPRTSLGDWKPTETIRIIVPAAAGGSTDVMGRLLAAHLQTVWGQSAVVENRSGGGGTIGTAEVIRQKGDGQTILIGNPGPNAIAFSIFRNLTYKADQLQPVSNMIRIPNIVSAHPSTGIKSIPELIAFLKTNPDKYNYASSGVGQSPHLTGAWFLQLTDLQMVHVPFRGAGPALQAALAGDVHILFDNLFPSLPQVQDGKLNGLCVTTTERSANAPDLPTMREGAPELTRFDVSSWFGVFLPKSCPPEIVNALNLQIKAMLDREEIRKNIAAMGARADYGTPQQFSDFVDAETKKFAAIIEKEGLQMEVK